MNPSVTIGLPYHNNAPYLAASIRSILGQSFADWELLLVDDGSTDDSLRIAQSFRDPRIRHFCDQRNLGLSCRLNQIAIQARGSWLFRMDADDLMHPDRIRQQMEALSTLPENSVLGTAAVEIDEQGRPLRILRSLGSRGTGFAARRAFIHPTVAARTAWFLENPYSESPLFRRSQDAELWVRTVARSRFAVLPAPLLFYRWSPGLSFDKYAWQAMALLKILTRKESGGPLARVGHSMIEVTKLQFRFLQTFLPTKNTGTDNRGSRHIPADLHQYAEIIDRLSLG